MNIDAIVFFPLLLVLLLVSAAMSTGWTVYGARLRKGLFALSRHGTAGLAFRSDFGLFEFDRAAGTLRMAGSGGDRTVALADVLAVRFRREETDALMEELFGGFDLLRRNRDRIVWHVAELRLRGGEMVPAYVAGQWSPRNVFSQRLVEWQWGWLRGQGWIPDAEEAARRVLARVVAQVPAAARDANG